MAIPDPALGETPPAGHSIPAIISGMRRWRWALGALLLLALGAVWFLTRSDKPVLPPPVPAIDDHQVKALVEQAHQAVVDNPRSGQAWGRLGMIYFANDYRGPALDLFIQAEKLDPTDYRWPYLQGIFLWDHGNHQAVACFERAMGLATTTDFPAYRLGLVYMTQGRFAEAARLFQELLAKSPANGLASLGLGKVALEENDLDRAEEHFLKAAEQALPRREAFRGLLEVHTKKKQPDKMAHYQTLFDMQPSEGADYDAVVQDIVKNQATGLKQFLTRVRQHLADQELRQANEVMENAVRQYPKDVKALGMSAYVLVELAQKTPPPEKEKLFERAEVNLHRALQIDPKSAHNWHRLGLIYHERGHFNRPALQQALGYYEKSLALNPTFEPFVVSHAACWKDMGELDKAVELLTSLAKSRPDVPLTCAQLGTYLIAAGRQIEALHFLINAAQQNQPGALERAFALAWQFEL